jgi:DNA-directed RNA polymerase specialized sigma24 family protein
LHFAQALTGDIADAEDLAQDKHVRAIGGAAS